MLYAVLSPSCHLVFLVGMQQDPNFLLKKNPSEKAVSMIQQTCNWERKEESLNEGNEEKKNRETKGQNREVEACLGD